MANCTPPTVWYAHGSTPPVSMPASLIRLRSMTASMRAMISSLLAITLFLLAELLAITNRYGSGSAATVSTYTRMISRVRS